MVSTYLNVPTRSRYIKVAWLVRKITASGTIGIAWTIVLGVYGTNFPDIPGLGLRLGYLVAFGQMAVLGLVLGFMFRRRGWL